jgi:hypothetical protein
VASAYRLPAPIAQLGQSSWLRTSKSRVQILLGALSADIRFSFGRGYGGFGFGIDVPEDTGTKISVYYN